MLKVAEFIALLLRNPAKIYRMESEYTEQHRRSPVVGLLTTSDAEKCSKTRRKKENPEELDLTKSDCKYLISMLSVSIATCIKGMESTLNINQFTFNSTVWKAKYILDEVKLLPGDFWAVF